MSKVVLVFVLLFSLMNNAFAQSNFETIKKESQDMLSALKVDAIELNIISLSEAKNNDSIQNLLNNSKVSFENNSVATALYFRGKCNVIVNDKEISKDLNPKIVNLISKDNLIFFITIHEVSHCISQHYQFLELRKLAKGEKLENTFLPKKVIDYGDKGLLNQEIFQKILKSKETILSEELFADILASAYTSIKKDDAEAILNVILKTRIEANEDGDEMHNTELGIKKIMSLNRNYSLDNIIDISQKIRLELTNQ